MQLNGNMVEDLIKVIKNGRFLIEFDISYNSLTCENMILLLKALSENRTLQLINLSWNVLAKQQKPQGPDGYFTSLDAIEAQMKENEEIRLANQSAAGPGQSSLINAQRLSPEALTNTTNARHSGDPRQSISSSRSMAPSLTMSLKRDSVFTHKKVESKFDRYGRTLDKANRALGQETEGRNNEVVKYLSTLIKRNKNLVHLDLTQTQLTEHMLWRIGMCLSRAKSLAAIHFSGNPGITPSLKEYLTERIRCRPG